MNNAISIISLVLTGCLIAYFYENQIETNNDLLIFIISVSIFFWVFCYSSDGADGDDDAK